MGGRPRKPTAIKELQGTLAPSRQPKDELTPDYITDHEAPSELNEWGVELWNNLFEEYGKVKLITKLDIGSMLIMCNEYGTYMEADDLIKAEGLQIFVDIFDKNGQVIGQRKEANPMIRVRDNASKQYTMLCKEFGLTPVSRSKISAPKIENEKDELEMLMG
jgi:P27 family predicted phage terminase small subunit